MLERVDTDWDCWCCFTGSENITTGYMSGMVCCPAFPKLVARNKQMPSKKLFDGCVDLDIRIAQNVVVS
jgi:hypothetical protein